MSERPVDRLDLERELGALAAAIDWPATPDVAASIRWRLAERSVPQRRRWLPTPRLGRSLVLAILLLALAVAVAAALALGLPGLRITFTSDPLPTPNVPIATTPGVSAAPLPGSNLELGTPMTLDQAQANVAFPLILPAVPGRPGPDATYLASHRGTPIVTFVWRAGPGLPPIRAGSDVGLLVNLFRATVDEGLIQKLVGAGTTVERIEVGGRRGFWIAGGEHLVWFRREDGEVVDVPIRLAGDTLALEIEGRVVRLEVAGGRDTALALAETISER